MAARLFVRPDPDDPRRGHFDPDAARHLRALRLQPGDRFVAITGPGSEREATLLREGGQFACTLGTALPRPAADPRSPVTLAVALADPPRLDLVVEKSVELGATRVVVFRAERSQRDAIGPARVDRWRRIARSACEQCGRTEPPEIVVEQGIEDVAAIAATAARALVFALPGRAAIGIDPLPSTAPPSDGTSPRMDRAREIGEAPDRDATGSGTLLVVGPEGGLTAAEVDLLVAAGACPTDLGPRILRFETAAIAALARFADRRPPGD